jgi:hypothetical protein
MDATAKRVKMDASANHQQPQYTYPNLEAGEIVQCLLELELDITRQQLQEPKDHKEKIRVIFLKFVSNMTCA